MSRKSSNSNKKNDDLSLNEDRPKSYYYLRSSLAEITDRIIVRFRSIFKAILFLIIFIWFLTGLLNLFPQIAWGYGFIWHVFNFFSIPVMFILSYSYYRPFLSIGLIVIIITVILDGFAFGLILYTLIICYVSGIPANCTNMQFTNIVISVLSGIIFILDITILFAYISVFRRINNATIFKKRNQRKV
jgi:hypothetical protein